MLPSYSPQSFGEAPARASLERRMGRCHVAICVSPVCCNSGFTGYDGPRLGETGCNASHRYGEVESTRALSKQIFGKSGLREADRLLSRLSWFISRIDSSSLQVRCSCPSECGVRTMYPASPWGVPLLRSSEDAARMPLVGT